MAQANTTYESLSAEQLDVLENDTLDQLRKLSAVGQNHSINGRNVSLPQREALIQTLADIRRAKASNARKNQIIASGGTWNGYHSNYAAFDRHG